MLQQSRSPIFNTIAIFLPWHITIKKRYWRWLQIIIVTGNMFRATSLPTTVCYFKTVVILVHNVCLKLAPLFPQHHEICLYVCLSHTRHYFNTVFSESRGPGKGNQGTTRGKEKVLLTSVGIEPTTSRLDLPFLCRLSYEVVFLLSDLVTLSAAEVR